MGFFQTIGQGYKIMWAETKLGWQRHGASILTGTGTLTMLISGLMMGRKGTKGEVQQAIAESEALIAQIEKERQEAATAAAKNGTSVDKKSQRQTKFKLVKAKGKKFVNVGKHYWKEGLGQAVGAGMVLAGNKMHVGKEQTLAAGAAAIAADFMAYRAAVVADQGEEKDLEYIGSKVVHGAKKAKLEDGTIVESADEDGGDVTVKADPNAFKFWFSPETCPSLYMDNLEMTKSNLNWVEETLTRMGRMNGHIYLNDMRREFGGLTPNKMDHPLGGIFGKVFDRSKIDGCQHIDLGWRADKDFCEGRKVGVWIIFPCDPEPIVSKVNQKMVNVEGAVR